MADFFTVEDSPQLAAGSFKYTSKKLLCCQFLVNNHEICGNSQKQYNNWLDLGHINGTTAFENS
jgi:hypothetical protein